LSVCLEVIFFVILSSQWGSIGVIINAHNIRSKGHFHHQVLVLAVAIH
jgi:hypothetical protein